VAGGKISIDGVDGVEGEDSVDDADVADGVEVEDSDVGVAAESETALWEGVDCAVAKIARVEQDTIVPNTILSNIRCMADPEAVFRRIVWMLFEPIKITFFL
jgi:hypothetical protein